MSTANQFQDGKQKILIIGGGAAGFFAAITAAENNSEAEVVILEQSNKTLSKVRISGGGRCNVTHACFDPRELVDFYPRGGKALRGPFTRFCTGDTMEWYESRGVALKIESDNRIFPVSDQSASIVRCLEGAAEEAGVKVLFRQKLKQLYPPEEEGQRWKVICGSGQDFYADQLMIATGSSPFVWELIRHLGHSIVEPVPSLFTFNIQQDWLHQLAGLSVQKASLKIAGSKLQTEGPILITHWGLSGPAILKASAWGAREFAERQYHFEVLINWLGHKKREDVAEEIRQLKISEARKTIVARSPFAEIPARLWKAFCRLANITEELRWADLNKKSLNKLAELLTQQALPVTGKSTFKEEFVTAGGVHLKEVDFKRFESRIHRGLFFAGEVLNIDALTGGFNFQAAWTGGYIAGLAMSGTDQ